MKSQIQIMFTLVDQSGTIPQHYFKLSFRGKLTCGFLLKSEIKLIPVLLGNWRL